VSGQSGIEKLRPVSDPDADLLPGLARGETTAVSALMDRHLKTVHALCYYMLGDTHLAEDVTQSVFFKTVQMIPSWKVGSARLLTWMRRTATNACLDILRKKKPVYMDDVPEMATTAASPFDALARQQQQRRVKAALMGLPDQQRAAITLCYYQGVSQKEGAQILGIGEKAYESLLSRGRATLKSHILKTDPRLKTERAGQ